MFILPIEIAPIFFYPEGSQLAPTSSPRTSPPRRWTSGPSAPAPPKTVQSPDTTSSCWSTRYRPCAPRPVHFKIRFLPVLYNYLTAKLLASFSLKFKILTLIFVFVFFRDRLHVISLSCDTSSLGFWPAKYKR